MNETESDDESESDASDSLIPIDKLPPFPPLDGDLVLEILNKIGSLEKKVEEQNSMLKSIHKKICTCTSSNSTAVIFDENGILCVPSTSTGGTTSSGSHTSGATPTRTTGTPLKVKSYLNIEAVWDIKQYSVSRKNFVKNLIFTIFDVDFLKTRNCNGSGGKEAIDPVVLTYVRHLAFSEFPLKAEETRSKEWKECVTATNRAISDANTKKKKEK